MKEIEKRIGQITAITFGGQVYTFDVIENSFVSAKEYTPKSTNLSEEPEDELKIVDSYKMYCKEINPEQAIVRFFMKPNFELIFENHHYLTDYKAWDEKTYQKNKDFLIKQYIISDELADKLTINGNLWYSVDMAYLYGLNPYYAYDRRYQMRAFKHVKDNNKRLIKQKQGIFH